MRLDTRKSSDPAVLERLIRLRDEEGLSFRVIGQRLGFKANTISSNYKREKKRRESLKSKNKNSD